MSAQKGVILAQRLARLMRLPRVTLGAFLLGLLTLTVVTAFGIAPGTAVHDMPVSVVSQPIPLPDLVPQAEPAQRFVTQERVLRGDTVAALFERLGIRDTKAFNFLRTDATGVTLFRQLVPGRLLQAETGAEGELLALRYFLGVSSILEVKASTGGFTARQRAISQTPQLAYKSGVIRSSLFAATDAAGIPDPIAMQIARIFSTDIDFHVDLRKGDRFSVVYEMIHESGEYVAPGRILAAEFVNEGRAYQAVLFEDADGDDAYYTLEGASRAKAFLRSPVEFSRISSGFGARFHPILKNWRAHTGVDFAAPKGTRVLAAADGHVVGAGWRGGYGNTVEIRHGGGVTTLYAHLSAISSGLRTGTKVRQGQAIGAVGATGWATGPHLHYEFKLAGVHQDPMRVALPKAEPVPPYLRAKFDGIAASARSTIGLVGAAPAARFE